MNQTGNWLQLLSVCSKMAASITSLGLKVMPSIQRTACLRALQTLYRHNKMLYSQSVAHTSPDEPKEVDPSPVDNTQNLNFQQTLEQEDYFQVKNLVTLKDLFQARVHLGHNAGLRHHTMSPFIFGERLGRDILDLEQTLPRLQEALNVCAHIVYRGGMILFLCRNMQVLPWVEKMAIEVKEYSHCRTWKSGIFTNASHTFNTLPIYPELCVFFNTQDTVFEQHKAVVESSKLLIPSIGFVDSNCSAQDITYPIPGNDDTPDSLHLYINLFRTAVLRAKEKRKTDGVEDR